MEIPFVFRNLRESSWMVDDTPETRILSSRMSGAFTAFARTGDPNIAGSAQWPEFESRDRATMIFNLTSRVENDPDRQAHAALLQLMGEH
jgi:para-nitrobenzyl esterase